MPVVSRSRLRQQLGLTKLRDTFVGTTTFSPNLGAGSAAVVMASRLANPAFSGRGMYEGSTFRIFGVDYHVASYNVGSGALISAQLAATVVGSGATFEHNKKISGDEKDRAIDGIVGHLWARQELPVNVVDGRLDYSIGSGFKIFDSYYFASPAGSGSRDPQKLPIATQIVTTATGRELRLTKGTTLGSGQQIILDAQVRASLGATDTATVSIPDEDWLLTGAAARCFQALVVDSPGKEAGKYQDLANAYAREFNRGIIRFVDQSDFGWRGAFGEYVA